MAIDVAIAAFVLRAGALAYGSTRPDDLRVERGAAIDAPHDVVFSIINDMQFV